MKKAVSIATLFTDVPFYDRFARAKAAGFDQVEIGGWTNLDLTRVADELQTNALSLAGLAGAESHALTNPEEREDFLEYLSQSIAVAKSFDCKDLILTSCEDAKTMPLDRSRQSDFTKIAAATRALMDAADKAHRAGVVLHVKPQAIPAAPGEFLETIQSVGEVVKVVNNPALQLLFPLGPVQALQNEVLDNLRRYRSHIGYIHLGSEQPALPPGGAADLPLVSRVLRDELAFRGVVCFVSRTGVSVDGDLAAWRDF